MSTVLPPSVPPDLPACEWVQRGDRQELFRRLDSVHPGPEWDAAAERLLWLPRQWQLRADWVEVWMRLRVGLTPEGAGRALVVAASNGETRAVEDLMSTVSTDTPGWTQARLEAGRRCIMTAWTQRKLSLRDDSWRVPDMLQRLAEVTPAWTADQLTTLWPAIVKQRHTLAAMWVWNQWPEEDRRPRLRSALRVMLRGNRRMGGGDQAVQDIARLMLDHHMWRRTDAKLVARMPGAPADLTLACAHQVGRVQVMRAAYDEQAWKLIDALSAHLTDREWSSPVLADIPHPHPHLPELTYRREAWNLRQVVGQPTHSAPARPRRL